MKQNACQLCLKIIHQLIYFSLPNSVDFTFYNIWCILYVASLIPFYAIEKGDHFQAPAPPLAVND